ncbi:MAG: GPW/gp25 family protein [Bacteroidales bacterium]|jgi:hypothetical protein
MSSDFQNNSFLGTGWCFPPTFPKEKKGVELTSDVEDINKSLEILLSTSVGERIMQPKYGSNLSKMIFEPLTTNNETYIVELLRQAILRYEPRIQLNEIKSDTSMQYEGVIYINIDYTVKTTNSRANYVYPFYLNEGTITKK